MNVQVNKVKNNIKQMWTTTLQDNNNNLESSMIKNEFNKNKDQMKWKEDQWGW